MSRRQQGARGASPEEIFAKRRGEIPYQIYFEISNIGRNVESSKKRARWKFCFGEDGREHEVTLVHSLMSGKKRTIFDGELINEAQKVSKEWVFAWSYGAHLLRVGINMEEYELVIDGISFTNFSRRDPYLAAQLEATKRDSMRSLQSDERRRFDRLGYGGSGSAGGRSRASERRSSGYSTASSRESSQRRTSSMGRSGRTDRDGGGQGRRRESLDERGIGGGGGGGGSSSRRSGSVEDRRRSSPSARALSTRKMQAPPSASASGGDQRRPSQSSGGSGGKPRVMKPPSADSSATAGPTATTNEDILSADPSTLEVNPFDAHVPAASFDPLNRGLTGGGSAVAGGGYPNGGGGGGYANGGGGGGYANGGGGHDSAAVLQLGMQFEAMGMGSHNQHNQYMQPPQQQQAYQTPFDEGVYQKQYDQSGFPMPQQQQQHHHHHQAYDAPQQAFQYQQQQAGGGAGFAGGFQQQDQQQQGAGKAPAGGPPASTCTDLAKASPDPWDVARAGMVNIDDITDTKHLPAVEVKPYSNDHRPLADLVRETPPQRASVMIDRPAPAPTHMAVAIVPLQGPGQHQRMGYAQGGFPQPAQNGNNPFAHLQLTQFGQQAQPVLFSDTPADPFDRL